MKLTSVAPAVFAHAQPKGSGILSFFADGPGTATSLKSDWKNAGVIDLADSPYAKLKTLPVTAVTIEGFSFRFSSFFSGVVEWCFCRGFCQNCGVECGVFVVSLW